MTVLEHVAGRTAADAPAAPEQSERLSIHLLDTVGAWLAGRRTEDGALVSRLFAGGAALDRLAARVAATRLTELDDIHMSSCTTPGSVVVWAALASAAGAAETESGAADSASFAQSLAAGYEAMTRLGMAVAGPRILYRGIWPTYLAAPFGAAAVTARALRLDAGRTADALGIALTLSATGAGNQTAPTSRWLLLGLAARAGVAAAQAAAGGITSDRTLLDGDWLTRAHGIACDPSPLVAPDGPASGVGALSIKPYCAAKQTIAAIEGFRALLDDGVAPDEIAAIRIAVPPAYHGMIGSYRAGGGRMARMTSIAYQCGLAAFRPEMMREITRPDLTVDPRIAALLACVEVVADESLAAHYPRRWPARVELTLRNGRALSREVLDAWGDPALAFDRDQARVKFHAMADPGLGAPAAERLAALCLGACTDDGTLVDLVTTIAAIEAGG